MSVFYGYPGRIWAIIFASVQHLNDILATSSAPAALPVAQAVLSTALNGLAAINANRIASVWQGESQTMLQVEILPVVLGQTDLAYFNNRQAALAAAGAALAALLPMPALTGVAKALDQGSPAVPDLGLLEFFEGFAYEAPPAGLTAATVSTKATELATAFADLAVIIASLQGIQKNYLYDQTNRFSIEASEFAEMLAEMTYSAVPSATALWNQLVALPTLLSHADLISAPPNVLTAQQDLLLRYLIVKIIWQLETFIMTTQRPVTQNILQVTVFSGDSIMDLAARALGDFERWTDLVSFNNLKPPYTGAAPASPSVATWGSKIMVPVTGGNPADIKWEHRNAGIACACYLYNFLGVDVYVGPLQGPMPAWTGDFQLIAGFDNLRLSLGRRMQTPLGALIYHSDYGSRIPPRVGQVQTAEEASLIASFGRACLLSDPRVQVVLSATATPKPNFEIEFDASVQPHGFGLTSPTNTGIPVNEVINIA